MNSGSSVGRKPMHDLQIKKKKVIKEKKKWKMKEKKTNNISSTQSSSVTTNKYKQVYTNMKTRALVEERMYTRIATCFFEN